MSKINFTDYYVGVLDNYLSYVKSMKTMTKEVLFFRDEETDIYYISKMADNIWVNVKAESDNVKFDPDCFAVESLDEFVRYIKHVNYPKETASSLSIEDSETRLGKVINTYKISGKGMTQYLPSCALARFKDPYDTKVPQPRDQDPLPLVGKFTLTKDEIIHLVKTKKLLGNSTDSSAVFGLFVGKDSAGNDKIDFAMKNNTNRQANYDVNSEIYDAYTTKDPNGQSDYKLFTSTFFDNMSFFKCDFEVELRYHAPSNSLVIKAYGNPKKPKNQDDKSDILILVGTQESKANQISNTFDLYRS